MSEVSAEAYLGMMFEGRPTRMDAPLYRRVRFPKAKHAGLPICDAPQRLHSIGSSAAGLFRKVVRKIDGLDRVHDVK